VDRGRDPEQADVQRETESVSIKKKKGEKEKDKSLWGERKG